jgi:spore coat polysaccharide biosynthesis protein SpsF
MLIGAIIQARCNSTRLPNKALLPLPISAKTNVLEHIARSIERSKKIEAFVVATSEAKVDDAIAKLFPKNIFRGDAANVLSRYHLCAKEHAMDIVVRLTGDNPCIDITPIDEAIAAHLEQEHDYSSITGLPLGLSAEIISTSALEQAYTQAKDPYELEHVTPFIQRRPERFALGSYHVETHKEIEKLRLTLDYPSDYALLNMLFTYLDDHPPTLDKISAFLRAYPWATEINPNYQKTHYGSAQEEVQAAKDVLGKMEMHRAAAALKAD